MTDKIAEVFNMNPIVEYEDEFAEPIGYKNDETERPENSEFMDDAEEVKDNIRGIIEKGTDVLEEMINLAKTSEQPRAYEVLAGMMKVMLDANKDLIDTSKKKHDIKYGKDARAPTTSTNITDSNVVVTSQAMLKQLLEKKKS